MLASSRSEVRFAPLAFLFPPWGSPRCKSDKGPILDELPTGHGRVAGGGQETRSGPDMHFIPAPYWCRSGAGWPNKHGSAGLTRK